MRPAQEGNGSLHLYRLKTHKVGGQNSPVQYSIRLAWKNDGLQGGVNTICPHPSGLLFSSGNILHLHQLDMAKGALENITHKTLRFPITSIHVTGDRICVTGYTESVSFYAYDEDTMHLSFLKSDSISRNVQHSLLLNNRTVVGASLSGGMFALMEPGTDSDYYEDSLQTLFCFHYPDIVIKPRCISLRSHHSTEYTAGILSDHLLPWTTNDNKATNHYHQQQCRRSDIQPIVGCTVSGGVIMAYRCSAALFATLDLLQHRLSRYILTQPLLGSVTRYLQWYNQLSGPQVSTIHLDLVSLYLRLTTKQQQQVVRLTDDPGYQYGIDDGMDDNDNRSEKETMTATTLVDLTLALVANGDQYCYKTIPNWTQRPNRNDDLVSWTALTLDLVVTKLEQYYY
ncbi:hypothetical protein BC941DRAFT_85728 [Chlamydoabsidia padenii]|nr:hypothetical protein BC941DRAFT_85728 [Chlamydoabsidia padenii]